MKRLVLALFGIATLLAKSACGDEVDQLVGHEMQRHQIAGVSLMVVKDGRQIKCQGYGVANLEWNVPVTKETVFEIGSLTKQFTAACILLLAQDGKLSLDDRLSRYLTNTPDSWSGVTLRHLLNHTSGIRSYTGLDGFELSGHQTREQFIQKIGRYPLAFAPGDSWSYCNTGYSLLGYVIEAVSGKSYWDFLHERIIAPLGMTATRDRDPGAIIPERAAGYQLNNHVVINRDYDLTDVFSAGAMVSKVEDLAKWDAALNDDKLLSKDSKDQMWLPTRLNDGTIKQYGFGWYLDPLDGHKNMGHRGSTSGFSCSLQRFPDDHLTVIVLSNVDNVGLGTQLAKEVAALYFSKGELQK